MYIRGISILSLVELIENEGFALIGSNRDYGYLTVVEIAPGGAVQGKATSMVGFCPTKKEADRHFNFSLIQAARLRMNPSHKTSFQNSGRRRRGAIRAGTSIMSFSGLSTDHENEILVLWLACTIRWLAIEEAREIARLSENVVALLSTCLDAQR